MVTPSNCRRTPASWCNRARIVRRAAAIADRCTVRSECRRRPPFADLIRDPKLSDDLSPEAAVAIFFAAIPISIALSSFASANCFFAGILIFERLQSFCVQHSEAAALGLAFVRPGRSRKTPMNIHKCRFSDAGRNFR
jgi:hypothetical protein